MIYAYIGITVLWVFLFCYIIIASIDFGSGFFALHSKMTGNEKKVNHLIHRYLNPVWEVTNVFFVFFFVGFIGFFPDSAKYLGTVLLVPGSIALILISIRSSFYAFENYGQDTKLPWIVLYGLTGLLIPASLATALTISEGGYIYEHGTHIDLDWIQLLLSPFAWSVVFLAIVSVLYISSGFLTYYAHKANDQPAYDMTRQWHIFWGPPMIVISLFVFLSLRIQNSDHFRTAIFNYWWRTNMDKEYVVIGLGRFGGSIVRELNALDMDVMAIDRNENRVNEYSDIATHAVVADTTDEAVMKSLGIRNFDHVIVAIGENIQSSTLTTLILKELGVKKVTAKAQNDYHAKILNKIGADTVVHPERDMGRRIAHNVASASVLDYLELADEHSIVELKSTEKMAGQTIIELDIRAQYGINIIAIKRAKEFIVSPDPNINIEIGDILIMIGHDNDLGRFEKNISK